MLLKQKNFILNRKANLGKNRHGTYPLQQKICSMKYPRGQFWKGQLKRQHRTNMGDNGGKPAWYNSQNVLSSGLFVFGKCGGNFRQITRPRGL